MASSGKKKIGVLASLLAACATAPSAWMEKPTSSAVAGVARQKIGADSPSAVNARRRGRAGPKRGGRA